MSQEIRALMARWFDEVWNNYNEASLHEMLSKDVVCYDFPQTGQSVGFEGFKAAVESFQTNFSNIHIELEDVIVEGNKAAGHWRASMTHTGHGLGFSATGETILFSGISWAEYVDGKIVKGWNGLDLTHPIGKLMEIAKGV